MPKRKIGTGLRLLLGLIGAAAIAAGVTLCAIEIRVATSGWPAGPAWLAAAVALFSAVVVLGGLLLVRGAITGRIVVRRTGPPR